MAITQERREQLLRGIDISTSAGNRGVRWAPDARKAPRWAQDRIVEVRAALADGKPVPPPSRDFCRDAEQRSAMRVQIENFNRRYVPSPRVHTVVSNASTTLSSSEARRLCKEHGVSFEDVMTAHTLQRTAGVEMVDTLNSIKLRQVTARVERAKELEDEDEFKDDPDSEWNSIRHARSARSHRVMAGKCDLNAGISHLVVADAHTVASNHFSRDTSRRARRAERMAFPESVIS